WNSGALMKVVDVLRDHRRRLACLVETRQRKMAAPRPCARKLTVHCKPTAPGLVTHFLARDKFVERDRLVLRPESARRTEVGNATLGGNSGSRERRDAARLRDQGLQAFHGTLQIGCDHVWSPHAFFPARRCKEVTPCDICTPCSACATLTRRSTSTATS